MDDAFAEGGLERSAPVQNVIGTDRAVAVAVARRTDRQWKPIRRGNDQVIELLRHFAMSLTIERTDSPTTATADSVAVGLWPAQHDEFERSKQLTEPSPFTFVMNNRGVVTTVIDGVTITLACSF
jgi:hypothetical protein